MTASKAFTKFGFLYEKDKRKVYLGFVNGASKEIARVVSPMNAEIRMVRNQQTKDELFLVQSSAEKGSTATCFYDDRGYKKSISFGNFHFFADQDVQHQVRIKKKDGLRFEGFLL
jgi:hypothetical protein